MDGRRKKALTFEKQRRQLSFIPRSARSTWPRQSGKNRAARDSLASSKQAGGPLHRRAAQSLRQDRGREGDYSVPVIFRLRKSAVSSNEPSPTRPEVRLRSTACSAGISCPSTLTRASPVAPLHSSRT